MPLLPDLEIIRLVVIVFNIVLASAIPHSRIMLPHAGRNWRPSNGRKPSAEKDAVIKHYRSFLSNVFGYMVILF